MVHQDKRQTGTDLSLKTVQELMVGAERCDALEQFQRDLQIGELKWQGSSNESLLNMGFSHAEIDKSEPIDPSCIRAAQDWSVLGGLVLGAEDDVKS